MNELIDGVNVIDIQTKNGFIVFIVLIAIYSIYVLTREILSFRKQKMLFGGGNSINEFINEQRKTNEMIAEYLKTIANKYSNISPHVTIKSAIEVIFQFIVYSMVNFIMQVHEKNNIKESKDNIKVKIRDEVSNYIDYMILVLDNYKMKGNVSVGILIDKNDMVNRISWICEKAIFDEHIKCNREMIIDHVERLISKEKNELLYKLNGIYENATN